MWVWLHDTLMYLNDCVAKNSDGLDILAWDLAQTQWIFWRVRYGKESEGRHSNTELLEGARENKGAHKTRKPYQEILDDVECGAGKH